jgi:hypothetical protein
MDRRVRLPARRTKSAVGSTHTVDKKTAVIGNIEGLG